LTDHLGSVRDVVDNSGTVQNHIVYDAFGGVTNQTNDSVVFRYGYTARELDAESGLQYNRARYLDSFTGKFISEDPISFQGGDSNLYRYVFNSPTNFIDSSGNAPTKPVEYKPVGILDNFGLGIASIFRGNTKRFIDHYFQGRTDPDDSSRRTRMDFVEWGLMPTLLDIPAIKKATETIARGLASRIVKLYASLYPAYNLTDGGIALRYPIPSREIEPHIFSLGGTILYYEYSIGIKRSSSQCGERYDFGGTIYFKINDDFIDVRDLTNKNDEFHEEFTGGKPYYMKARWSHKIIGNEKDVEVIQPAYTKPSLYGDEW
jgi:RHS repeat-associated protein